MVNGKGVCIHVRLPKTKAQINCLSLIWLRNRNRLLQVLWMFYALPFAGYDGVNRVNIANNHSAWFCTKIHSIIHDSLAVKRCDLIVQSFFFSLSRSCSFFTPLLLLLWENLEATWCSKSMLSRCLSHIILQFLVRLLFFSLPSCFAFAKKGAHVQTRLFLNNLLESL